MVCIYKVLHNRHFTEATIRQHNTGAEEYETSTSEALGDTSVSTPVHWTPTSATPSPEEQDETNQTHDTDDTENTEESATLQPNADATGTAMAERTSTRETTTAHKTGDISLLKWFFCGITVKPLFLKLLNSYSI